MKTTRCILCYSDKTFVVLVDELLYTYLECSRCGLYFANPEERIPPEEEKLRYLPHENNPDDPDYRAFLNQLFEPLNQRLPPNRHGLDYGSGPGPTLHLMFEDTGHKMDIYDPFFADNPEVLEKTYDFITCTETAEHFYHPGREFQNLWTMLKPGGLLGIMTWLLSDAIDFKTWHYRRDETHVAFYQKKTFEWLADRLNANLDILSDRVIILEK